MPNEADTLDIVGTDWQQGVESRVQPTDVADRMYLFEDVWEFEVDPGGWYPAND